jgi:hypothetical protein
MHHYLSTRDIHLLPIEVGHLAGLDRRILMKTMILAAVAAMSLGVGAAYAQGVPAGFHEPAYSAQAFSDHPKQASSHFLGKDTVLGKMFTSSSTDHVATAANSANGG